MASERAPVDPPESAGFTESCPLIRDNDALEAQKSSSIHLATPVPRVALFALCSVRLVEPIAFTQIFPWINEFILDLRVTDDLTRIGFYSGLVESAFAIAQLFSIYPWARVSDQIGRRPVLLIGATGAAITSLTSGVSKSLYSTLVSRFIAGLFLGNIAVVHSVVCELSDPTNQAIIFSIYGLFWPIGTIIGPLIGGSLANAATKHPHIFNYEFLREYPYFLPCLVVAIISILGFILGYLFLEETLPTKTRAKKEKGFSASYGATNNMDMPVQPPSVKQLLATPFIRALCISGCVLAFISTSFDVVFVLFCYSPIHLGGLGFSASQIGYSLAIAGTVAAFMQITIMPYLMRRFDTLRIYNFTMALWPYAFVTMPLLNLVARNGLNVGTGQMSTGTQTMLWSGICMTLMLSRFGALSFSVSMILVKEHTSPSWLGTTNGLVQGCMCLSRSLAPAFVSSSFALSIDNDLLGGHMWVVLMVLICRRGSLLAKDLAKVRNL